MREKNLSVDCAVFGFANNKLMILLVQWEARSREPVWALPGEFLELNETVDSAAYRVLKEWTGLDEVYLQQGKVFSKPNRFIERVVSVSYSSLVSVEKVKASYQGKGLEMRWFALDELPELAFDHSEILVSCLNDIRAKVRTEPIGFELLGEFFTMPQLQGVYEAVFERKMDRRNFRKKIISFDLLEETGMKLEGTNYRAPKLYRFRSDRYMQMKSQNFYFEI